VPLMGARREERPQQWIQAAAKGACIGTDSRETVRAVGTAGLLLFYIVNSQL